ncbi:hypothetical protein ABT158_50140 [Nonomuraea sp. NPDC001636]|uniref:hypothetical protein n=1 Tax=Nonomuraea sp. NPDC001636 TaxID=3154391 RepID=UPI00331790BD
MNKYVHLCVMMVLLSSVSLCAGCDSQPTQTEFHENPQDFQSFAENAWASSRPDYGLYPGSTVEQRGGEVVVETAVYPLGSSAEGYSRSWIADARIDTESETVRASALPRTRLGHVLEQFGSTSQSSENIKNTRRLLAQIGASVEVTAVVELAEPMTEESLWGSNPSLPRPQRALLSRAEGALPIGNSLNCGKPCDAQSYVSVFQKWVSVLQARDRGALAAFDLDLERLKKAAQEGKIYGLIYESYDPRSLLEISKNAQVKALYVADVNLKCRSGESATCEPT